MRPYLIDSAGVPAQSAGAPSRWARHRGGSMEVRMMLVLQAVSLVLVFLLFLFMTPVTTPVTEESPTAGTGPEELTKRDAPVQVDTSVGTLTTNDGGPNANPGAPATPDLTPFVNKVEGFERELGANTRTIGEVKRKVETLVGTIDGLAKEGGALAGLGPIKELPKGIEGLSKNIEGLSLKVKGLTGFSSEEKANLNKKLLGLESEIVRLHTRVHEAQTRKAAPADTLVVVCDDSNNLPFASYKNAYLAALLDDPNRSWFENHRIGLWVYQANKPQELIALGETGRDAEAEQRKRITSYSKSRNVTVQIDEVAADLANRLKQGVRDGANRRVVLVVPATSSPPKQGWGDMSVDVLLVSSRNDPEDQKVVGWVQFCASHSGLFALLRPEGATVTVAAGSNPAPAPVSPETSRTTQPPTGPPSDGSQPANPPAAARDPRRVSPRTPRRVSLRTPRRVSPRTQRASPRTRRTIPIRRHGRELISRR